MPTALQGTFARLPTAPSPSIDTVEGDGGEALLVAVLGVVPVVGEAELGVLAARVVGVPSGADVTVRGPGFDSPCVAAGLQADVAISAPPSMSAPTLAFRPLPSVLFRARTFDPPLVDDLRETVDARVDQTVAAKSVTQLSPAISGLTTLSPG